MRRPHGGACTIERYVKRHQEPFRTQLGAHKFNGHICRMAEGTYGGFFGWANLTMECTGPYMGLPPAGKFADMRVVDIYRRGGDRLAENRVFIDMLHFLNMQGPDVLAQLEVRARQAFSCGMQRLSASEKGRKPCRSPINWLAHFLLRPDAPHARPLWTR